MEFGNWFQEDNISALFWSFFGTFICGWTILVGKKLEFIENTF
jgi:hypothetical protein